MSRDEPVYTLPKQVERLMGALSKLYAAANNRTLLEVLVNSQVTIREGWTYDNWDGGTYGHLVVLTVPEDLFLSVVEKRQDIEKQLAADINKLHNEHNEHIAEVVIELPAAHDANWRSASGIARSPQRLLVAEAIARVWGTAGYRVFLSHKAEVKREVGVLKADLAHFGMAGFVAHEDIEPTREWQAEIENALHSMDAFVALLTDGFHNSLWTDQEVGFAFGKGVPIVSVRLGKDPYGFIGKFQGLACSWKELPARLAAVLIKHDGMRSAYVRAVKECPSFDTANQLATILPEIDSLSPAQVEGLKQAFADNSQIYDAYGFNGGSSAKYGRGLAFHLERVTGRKFRTQRRKIEEVR